MVAENEKEETCKIDRASPELIGSTVDGPALSAEVVILSLTPFAVILLLGSAKSLPRTASASNLGVIYFPVVRLRKVEWAISHVGLDGQLVVGKVLQSLHSESE